MGTKAYIGVDPGNSTGSISILAVYDESYTELVSIEFKKHPFPEWLQVLEKTINDMDLQIILSTVEEVHSDQRSSSKSMFSFGGNYYAILTVLFMLKCPLQMRRPDQWQIKFVPKGRGKVMVTKAMKTRWKNELKKAGKTDDEINESIDKHIQAIEQRNTRVAQWRHNRLKTASMMLFPGYKITNDTAASALLAYYTYKSEVLINVPDEELPSEIDHIPSEIVS